MSTLRIEDLNYSNELGSSEMAAVSGGFDIGAAISNVIGILVHGVETIVVSSGEEGTYKSNTGKSTVTM